MVNKCFENNRPTEIETGVKLLDPNKPVYDRKELNYISDNYTDTRPIYFPPIAKEIISDVKREYKEEAALRASMRRSTIKQN